MAHPLWIDYEKTVELQKSALCALYLPPLWRVYAAHRQHGRTNKLQKYCVVPEWAWRWGNSKPGFVEYYLAHELAHAYSLSFRHDNQFYEAFKMICPKHLQHYELEYKPRNAAAAGITKGNRNET